MSSPDVPASRRARLIAAAIDLFTRAGVRRTSIDDIAAAAAVGKGSVYLEFRGKDELFRAAADQLMSDILAAAEAAAARDAPLPERLADVLLAKFHRFHDLVHSRPHARELMDAKDATAADLFRAADDRYAALVTAALAAAVERGEWRPAPAYPPAVVAPVLLRAAHGNAYGGGHLTAAAYRKRLLLAVELILAGATAPASADHPGPGRARRPIG